MYHFISGYTAKIPGTEVGVREPQVTFSACFGAPFLIWHPAKYAQLLATKLKEHDVEVWLVNTGWSGGSYGMGSRIQSELHSVHHRRHPHWRPELGAHTGRSGVRTRSDHRVSETFRRKYSFRKTPGMTRIASEWRLESSRGCL